MKRFIRKFFVLFFVISFIPSVILSPKIEAKTIRDLRRELDEIYEREKENNTSISLNQNEINNIKNEVQAIYTEIENINNTIRDKNEEIDKLNEEIKEKDESSKNLMASLQTTNGNSFYIEYLFGADSITDFIYRYTITEQITTYHEKLIDEMNEKIESAKKLKEELKEKEEELKVRQDSLSSKLVKLEQAKEDLYEVSISIEDEIKNSKQVIQMYLDAGCSEDDDISVCANKLLPADTRFWRPFEHGGISSEYGYRYAIYDSKGNLIEGSGLHEGIDLTNGLGTKNQIYAVANGKVAAVWYDKWGGNQVTIHHNINGKSYSSSYAHMSKVVVSEGDIVTKDTMIGYMGATGMYVTGYHLHLAISTGLRFTEYTGQAAYVAKTVNPRTLINFPSSGSWKDRVHYYN